MLKVNMAENNVEHRTSPPVVISLLMAELKWITAVLSCRLQGSRQKLPEEVVCRSLVHEHWWLGAAVLPHQLRRIVLLPHFRIVAKVSWASCKVSVRYFHGQTVKNSSG